MTGHPEIVEALKSQLLLHSDTDYQLNDEDIPDFQEFLARNKTIAEYFSKSGVSEEKTSYHRPWYKKVGIAVPVTIALLACFLAFTTTGKALAESLYKTIIHWFDQSVEIQYGPNAASTEPNNGEIQYCDSFDEVRSLLDMKIAQNDQAVLWDQITIEHHADNSSVIQSTYISDFHELVVTQSSFFGETDWNSNLKYSEGEVVDVTADGMQFVGYVLNNHGYAIAYTEKMSVQIRSDDIDYDHFVNFLEGMIIE